MVVVRQVCSIEIFQAVLSIEALHCGFVVCKALVATDDDSEDSNQSGSLATGSSQDETKSLGHVIDRDYHIVLKHSVCQVAIIRIGRDDAVGILVVG